MCAFTCSRRGRWRLRYNMRSLFLCTAIVNGCVIGSMDGFNHLFSTMQAIMCQIKERILLPAPYTKVCVPILQNLVIVYTAFTKFHLSLLWMPWRMQSWDSLIFLGTTPPCMLSSFKCSCMTMSDLCGQQMCLVTPQVPRLSTTSAKSAGRGMPSPSMIRFWMFSWFKQLALMT